MSNCMKYKDYFGTVEYSDEDECFHGKVLGINGLVTFEGQSVQELKQSFQDMVDEYIADCEEKQIPPNKSYKGTFNVRIAPELHRRAVFCAAEEGISLNALVERAISDYTGVTELRRIEVEGIPAEEVSKRMRNAIRERVHV